MTIQQIKLVIETAETGSISAAAKKFNISQPNASMSIKKLEDELGYQLFSRIGSGIVLTEQGYRFIEHAQVVLAEDQAIRAIQYADRFPRLRVGIMNIGIASDAFLRFCHENIDTAAAEYLCINVSPDTGARLLKERKLDIVVSAQFADMMQHAELLCKENRFTLITLAHIPMCVRIRKDHPLVENGTIDGSFNSLKQLAAYPYVEYLQLEDITEQYKASSPIPFGFSYKIYVEERDTRLKILQQTNAYAIGYELPKARMDQYGLVSYSLKAEAMLVAFIRKGDENLEDVARYLELLKEEALK